MHAYYVICIYKFNLSTKSITVKKLFKSYRDNNLNGEVVSCCPLLQKHWRLERKRKLENGVECRERARVSECIPGPPVREGRELAPPCYFLISGGIRE